jgi:hypothetical protein
MSTPPRPSPYRRPVYESPIERQIREAQERGDFDNLAGSGKPLPDHGPHDETWWLRGYLQREGLPSAAFLPAALALRKEADDLPSSAAKLRTEDDVRALVADLNHRVDQAIRKPPAGPPVTMGPVDVERVVDGWRAARAGREAERIAAAAELAPPEPPGESKRRWWQPKSAR